MIASTPCWRMMPATSAWSPLSPTTSGTPAAIAQSFPVERLSSTTDALAGIDELEHHVAADISGSAGDQDRHERVSRNNLQWSMIFSENRLPLFRIMLGHTPI